MVDPVLSPEQRLIIKRLIIQLDAGELTATLHALHELLNRLESSSFTQISIESPLALGFDGRELREERFRLLPVVTTERLDSYQEQEVKIYYSDLFLIVYDIKEWLLQNRTYLGEFSTLSGPAFASINRLAENIGETYESEAILIQERQTELRQATAVLLNVLQSLIDNKSAASEATDSLQDLIRALELSENPLSYWSEDVLPLALAFKKSAQTAPTIGSESQTVVVEQLQTVRLTYFRVTPPESRETLRDFILALRKLLKNPPEPWLRKLKVTSLNQVLTPAEQQIILSSNNILFPEEEDVATRLAGNAQRFNESDNRVLREFLEFFVEKKVIARLLGIEKLEAGPNSAQPANAEPESEGGDQEPTPPIVPTQTWTLDTLAKQYQDQLITAVIHHFTQLSEAEFTQHANSYADLINFISQQIVVEGYRTSFLSLLNQHRNGQANIPGLTWQEQTGAETSVTTSPDFYQWLVRRVDSEAISFVQQYQVDLTAQLLIAADRATPTNPDLSDTSVIPLPGEDFDQAKVSSILQEWDNPDTQHTSVDRALAAGSIYRREAIRLENIVLYQYLSFYNLPFRSPQEVPAEIRSLFADEVEYALRRLGPDNIALLSYPSKRLQLLKEIFTRVSHNPAFMAKLQSSFDRYANRSDSVIITSKAAEFEEWLTANLNTDQLYTIEQLGYLIDVKRKQTLLETDTGRAELNRLLTEELADKLLFGTSEASAVERYIDGLIRQRGEVYILTLTDLEQLPAFQTLRLDEETRLQLLPRLQRYWRARSFFLSNQALAAKDNRFLLHQITNGLLSEDAVRLGIDLDNIERTIDALILLKRSPHFLYTLSAAEFEQLFRTARTLTQDELQILVRALVEYMKLRALELENQFGSDSIGGDWDELTARSGRLTADELNHRFQHLDSFREDIRRYGLQTVVQSLIRRKNELESLENPNETEKDAVNLRQIYWSQLKNELQTKFRPSDITEIDQEGTPIFELNDILVFYDTPENQLVEQLNFPQERLGSLRTNPVGRLRKPPGALNKMFDRGRALVGRKKSQPAMMAASSLGNAIVPGAGTTIKGLSLIAGTILGKKGRQAVEKAGLVGLAGVLAFKAMTVLIWMSSTLAKIGSVIGSLVPGLGTVAGTWAGFLLEKTLFGSGVSSATAAAPNTAIAASGASQAGALAQVGTVAKSFISSSSAPAIVGCTTIISAYCINVYMSQAAFLDPMDVEIADGEVAPLDINKSASPSMQVIGDQDVTYSLRIKANIEVGSFTNITVTDAINEPDQSKIQAGTIQIVDAGGAECNTSEYGLNCTLTELGAGESVEIAYRARTTSVMTPDGKTTLANNAQVSGSLDGTTNTNQTTFTLNSDGSIIAQKSLDIVNGLQRGWWGYWNYHTSYPQHFDYDGWSAATSGGSPPCTSPDNEDCPGRAATGLPNDMFWCTWNVIYAHQEAGKPIPSSLTGVAGMRSWFQTEAAQGRAEYIANPSASDIQVGDVAFFAKDDPDNPRESAHVAIVGSISGTNMTTYDSNNVNKEMNYTINSGTVRPLGIVRLNGVARLR